MSLIKLTNIRKEYSKRSLSIKALNGIDLEIKSGELVSIMGSSGSGKSTLLNILGFLDKPNAGEYYLDGELTNKFNNTKLANLRNSLFGFVVQNFALIDDYTIYENVKIPLDYNKTYIKNKRNLVLNVLEKLGISNQMKKYPYELSGGQNQRVAIARALVNKPKIILADEPTGALDKKTSQDVVNIIKEINLEKYTIILVTHNQSVANQSNRIIKIEDGIILEDKKSINKF